MRRLLIPAIALALAGACGGEPRVPEGVPLEVVRQAPEATAAAGPADVFLEAPGETLNVELDLGAGTGPAEVRRRVVEILSLLDDAEEARPFGGQQVRGAATFRYEVITAEGADIDVWVDNELRVRRIQIPAVPLPPDDSPPPTQPENGLPALLTVDLVFAA